MASAGYQLFQSSSSPGPPNTQSAQLRIDYAPNNPWRNIANEAYEVACKSIQDELGNGKEAKSILEGQHNNIEEIHTALQDAQSRYNKKIQNGFGFRKSIWEISSRILHYGKVLDVLAQHHPEYVSLAWGTMRFILIGIIEHERLVEEFSAVLVEVGDVLPQASLIAQLFPTDDMRDAIARLYTQMLYFLVHALKWYNRSGLRRVLAALKNPYDLKCKDIVSQIRSCSELIYGMADGKSRAEIRDIRIRISKLEQGQQQVQHGQQQFQATLEETLRTASLNLSSTERIEGHVSNMSPRVREIQISQFMDGLKPDLNPQKTLSTLQAWVSRTQSTLQRMVEPKQVLRSLQSWMTGPETSMFILRVARGAEAQARELVTDAISHLQKQKVKVIWKLTPPTGTLMGYMPSPPDVFRVLIYQALTLQAASVYTGGFKIGGINSLQSDTDWATCFRQVASQLSDCFIIIQADNLFHAHNYDRTFIAEFVAFFKEIASDAKADGRILKLLVLCYGDTVTADDYSGLCDVVAVLKKPAVVPVRSGTKSLGSKKGIGSRQLLQ